MAISNLSTQYISASFQNLMQVSSSGEVFSALGTQITSLDVTATYATTAGSAASITGLDTAAFATTGSNTFDGNQEIQGNLIVSGDLTANQYIVNSTVYAVTQSFSSGSTIFGNDSLDTHQFTGSLSVLGSVTATSFTGSILGTASNAALLNSQAASYYTNASNINAGTISDLYLPATISSDITGNAATATTASYISPTFISASAAASGFGTSGGASVSASYAATASVCTGYAQGAASVYSIATNSNLTLYPLFTGAAVTSYGTTLVDAGAQISYNPSTNILTVDTISATAVTASFLGTGSYATMAASASVAGTAAHATSATSASYAMTASYALNGGGSSILVANEGSTLTSSVTSLNFVGNAVNATNIGNAVTVTIATGSAGGGSTSPGGSSGQVQFNNGGSFDGAAGLVVDISGNVTTFLERQLESDVKESHVLNRNLESGVTLSSPGHNVYALNGTKVILSDADSNNPKEGQVYGWDSGLNKWSPAQSDRNSMTGSLALITEDQAGSGTFTAWLPGTLAVVNVSSTTAWNAGASAYPNGTVLYCDDSSNIKPYPPTTSGEHVRVLGHVYQTWTDGGSTYATFLFNPDGTWVTL